MDHTYALADNAHVRRSDGAVIPDDTANRDWQAYQAWCAAGNAAAPLPEPAIAPEVLSSAQTALAQSDVTLLRCLEAGIAIPTAWSAYRQGLRHVLAGDATSLPTRPAYPAGT